MKVVLPNFGDNPWNHASELVSQMALAFLPGEFLIPLYERIFEEEG